ncbi:MAG: hypothetical protein GAK29_00892 [Acinetobacter bereziniae]|uniref:Phage protein n=1 Tax=Acinetobacter bereziniae TaxID=106648 RepID=A0A833U0D9_ACIBZ|nr:MAG: hypothetical protein GAK29_00892 [Acinetobacter bereziniae]
MLNIRINVNDQINQVRREHRNQIDFALAQTVNKLAKLAQAEEKKGLASFFDNPTPFTMNSVAIKAARKGNPTAIVFIRPIAAKYIEPYEYGGTQYLGAKPADLVPINATANQYGNLPRNTIKKYMNRKDVFLGKVRTSSGVVYGLWQRPTAQARRGAKRVKGGRLANTTGSLKLLVSFAEPVNTRKRLNFGQRSIAVVQRNAKTMFERSLASAIASAR